MNVRSNGHVERVVARLADQVERRYFGKYRGFVVDNEDPEQLGRLKLRVPSVLGDEVVTGWAMPCVPYGGAAGQGQLCVPDTEAGVWVEFEEGDPEFPIWVGCFWSKPGGESELPTPTDAEGTSADAPQDPPTRKILKTAQGHTLQFEDGDESLRIILADGDKENRIAFSDDGLTITNKENAVTMNDDGLKLEDGNGNTVTQSSSGVTVDATSNEVVLKGGTIKVGETAAQSLVIGELLEVALKQQVELVFATHTHVGNMGAPTSPPNPPPMTISLANALSKHQIEK